MNKLFTNYTNISNIIKSNLNFSTSLLKNYKIQF